MGLDIGTTSVRAAELGLGKHGVTLTRFGQVALPPGAVRGGEVVDVAAVTAALRQLWSQARFTTRRVVLGVANQKVVVRQVDLPAMPLDELRASLPYHVQDHVPMAVEHALLDFHPLEEVTNDAGARMLRVLLVAAARGMVDLALDAVTEAGLRPVMVDLTSFALLRAQTIGDCLGLSDGAEALVDVGAEVTNIVVHSAGIPRFVRILMLGGAELTKSLAERLGVPLDEAEALKQSTGLVTAPEQVLQVDPAARVLQRSCGDFVEEVRGSLQYYLAQPGSAPVTRIVLSGGGGQLLGLAERLSASTRMPVEVLSPLRHLEIGKTGLVPEQLSYIEPLAAVPVGLALGVAA
ncbi:MAG: pilus assembly protein PilM [Actinomycetota bacterium]|nr:pilus assembly protein PilM [Actinomycetota bacterium]